MQITLVIEDNYAQNIPQERKSWQTGLLGLDLDYPKVTQLSTSMLDSS